MGNYIALNKHLKGFLRAEQVLEDKDIESPYITCEIVGLCFYIGEVITFLVKLPDGEVFSYIPATAIKVGTKIKKEPSLEEFSLKDLSFLNSPSDKVSLSYIDSLNGDVSVFIKDKQKWVAATYVSTIDFYEDNELVNLVILNNGHLAFVPFHKMKFKEIDSIKKSFLPYKKQRNTYKI